MSPYSLLHQKRPRLSESVGKKWFTLRVEFADYHNVQMDLEFSGFPHCAVSTAAVANTGI